MHKRSKHGSDLLIDLPESPDYLIEYYWPSVRTLNALKCAGIISIFDVEKVGRDGLKDIKHLGLSGYEEVEDIMERAKEKYILKF